jgi:hypothetical protein
VRAGFTVSSPCGALLCAVWDLLVLRQSRRRAAERDS